VTEFLTGKKTKMTKATSAPKFTGELAEPILAPMPDGDDPFSDGVLMARILKFSALAKHYGVKEGDGFALAYAMALDLVPGFKVLYDDPRARALKLPNAYYGNGTRPKGSGSIPEVFDGEVLLGVFGLFKQRFPKDNDIAIADRIVLCLDAGLAGAAYERERDALGKTLRNRLGAARRAVALSRKHPCDAPG
jgi:hypothetical protein